MKRLKLSKVLNILIWIIIAITGYRWGVITKEAFATGFLSDFHVYYYIPKSVLQLARPEHPYTNFTPIFPYFFPPASIPLFYGIIIFPLYISKIFWTLLNIAASIASIYLIHKILNNKNLLYFWIMMFLTSLYHPFIFTINTGQFNAILLFIYTFGLYSIIKNKNNLLAGILIGIGSISKVSPAIIGIYLLKLKKYKTILAIVLTGIVLVILSEVLVKQGINTYYVRHVLNDVARQAEASINYREQSLMAFMRRFYIFENPEIGIQILYKQLKLDDLRAIISYYITFSIIGLISLIEIFKPAKNKYNTIINYQLLVIIGVIGTGLTWFHQYTMLLLPYFIFIYLMLSIKKMKIKFMLFSVSILVFIYNSQNLENKVENYWLQLNLFYTHVIVLIVFLILRIKNVTYKTTKFPFYSIKPKIGLVTFVIFSLFAINPFTINEYLRYERDKSRISSVEYIAKTLQEKEPNIKQGIANSYINSYKLDEGYVLFEKREDNKVRDKLSILFLDPINNSKYNIEFIGKENNKYLIKTRLESKEKISKYGEFFECNKLYCE